MQAFGLVSPRVERTAIRPVQRQITAPILHRLFPLIALWLVLLAVAANSIDAAPVQAESPALND